MYSNAYFLENQVWTSVYYGWLRKVYNPLEGFLDRNFSCSYKVDLGRKVSPAAYIFKYLTQTKHI